MSLTQFGASIAGLLLLAIGARLLKLGESRIADADTAARMAEELLAGFDARRAIVSTDGNAALVAGNGAIAVLKRRGASVAARRLLPPLDIGQGVEAVTVHTGERLLGDVTLLGVIDHDVRRLESELTRM